MLANNSALYLDKHLMAIPPQLRKVFFSNTKFLELSDPETLYQMSFVKKLKHCLSVANVN